VSDGDLRIPRINPWECQLRLSDAYEMMGMQEKAEEYAVRAKKVQMPRVSM
jgi:hypothetical protein